MDNDISYLTEFEHITLAKILIVRYTHDGEEQAIHKAMSLLDRLLKVAKAGGRIGSLIEILLLQALAHTAQGNTPPALAALEQALTLAEPEGYVQIFVGEGQPMQTLLAKSLTYGTDPAYAAKLLAAINQQMGEKKAKPDPNQLLIEPLSKRGARSASLVGSWPLESSRR